MCLNVLCFPVYLMNVHRAKTQSIQDSAQDSSSLTCMCFFRLPLTHKTHHSHTITTTQKSPEGRGGGGGAATGGKT